jgi:hypothetical protein
MEGSRPFQRVACRKGGVSGPVPPSAERRTELAITRVSHDVDKRIWHPRRRMNVADATFACSEFAGKDGVGIGHNVPQEARQTFAEALVDVGSYSLVSRRRIHSDSGAAYGHQNESRTDQQSGR